MNPAPLLESLLAGEDLSARNMEGLMDAMLRGELEPEAIAGLLVALRAKGETVEEIAAARVMRRHAVKVEVDDPDALVDTCGTGGDGSGTFNLSTAAALVAAAAGARVAKHGNRSVSSRSGSADVLEALGVRLTLPPERIAELIEQVGIGFLFAPAHHGATRHAVGPRRALGVRTLFNVLGPLTNPAGARRQVMGVYSPDLVEPIAQVLVALGARHAWVVHGAGGLDELSISGPSHVAEVIDGAVRTRTLRPEDAGLEVAPLHTLAGGDAEHNAEILRAVFGGERSPRADAVAYGAGAALVVAGVHPDIRSGVEAADEALRSGAAEELLARLVEASAR